MAEPSVGGGAPYGLKILKGILYLWFLFSIGIQFSGRAYATNCRQTPQTTPQTDCKMN